MGRLAQGGRIQIRVIQGLIIRELITRFGRENIGFLWVMAEPLLFAMLVGLLWRFEKGPQEHGVNIIAFVATGYLPLVMFRSTVTRAIGIFAANSSLLYHRQVKILDLVLVRFVVEFIGHMMAYVFIATVLFALDQFPWPHDLAYLLLGWLYYGLFSLTVAMVVAPLSEMSEVMEKVMPVITYLMVPFSGAFYLVGTLSPAAAEVVLYSPPVNAMEMMRYGLFGPSLNPQFDYVYPLACALPCMALGLLLCRIVRKRLIVE